jgi:hypothetical protein
LSFQDNIAHAMRTSLSLELNEEENNIINQTINLIRRDVKKSNDNNIPPSLDRLVSGMLRKDNKTTNSTQDK